MSSHDRSVVQAFTFGEGDFRWAGQVEVIRRVTTFDDGTQREFIDLQLRIGERFLGLPPRYTEEVIKALQNAAKKAEEESAALPPPPPRNDSHGGRGDRGGNDRGRRRHDDDGSRRRR